jgi:hypothetical protein
MRRPVVAASGEQLREQQRQDHLTGQLGVRPLARLRAQQQNQRPISH